jgi:hypothetical protein
VAKITEKQLTALDAKRDLGAELLQAVRDMKAGKGRVVWKARRGRRRTNPHVGESFDTFLKEEGIYEAVQKTAQKRPEARASGGKQQDTARRQRQTRKEDHGSRGKRSVHADRPVTTQGRLHHGTRRQ